MEDEERKIHVPSDLGMRLTDWHSSMYDPVYAVSSSTLAKRPVPESTFRGALVNMEACLDHPAHAEHQQEVKEIVSAMRAVLGEAEVRQTIINAMARFLWAISWGDEMECRDKGVGNGADITHVAPQTPPEALEHAKNLLEEFEELNSTTIEKVIENEKPENVYDFGGCMADNFLGLGGDPIGDYETPWCESSQLWDLIPEEGEES